MTLDQIKDIIATVLDIGTPGIIVFALLAMWKGWIVPKRETIDMKDTIKIQAETIETLEKANDRLLDEIAKPLAEVLSALTARRR